MFHKYSLFSHWFIKIIGIGLVLGLTWLFLGFGLPKILPEKKLSNTLKSGVIFQDERWSGEIRIVGDIWALPGTTVTIEPGTQIKVNDLGDSFNLHYLPWGLKSGLNTGEDKYGVKNGELYWDERNKIQVRFAKLVAIGTQEQPVIFESTAPKPGGADDINIISLTSGIIAHAKLSNYRRLLVSGSQVVIRDSSFFHILECAVCIDSASPVILSNIFSDTHRAHILILDGSPRISDNIFNPGLGEGVVLDPNQIGAPRIFHNNFEMSGFVALNILSGTEQISPQVYLNNFSGDSIIQLPCDSRTNFTQNQIRGFIRLAQMGNCVGKMVWGKNYWASDNIPAIIKEKFLGKEAQFEVLIPEVLISPPPSGRRSLNE